VPQQILKPGYGPAVEDNMVDGLFCASLTSRRRGHNPFV